MQRNYERPRAKSRWSTMTVVAFAAAIAIVAAMALLSLVSGAPMPIDLIATAQSVTMETAEEEVRLPPFLADEITVIGSGQIEGAPGMTSFPSAATISRIEFSPPLTLQSINIGPGSAVTLRKYPGLDRTYEILLRPSAQPPPASELTVFARDGFRLNVGRETKPYLPAAPHDMAAAPQALRFALAGGPLLLRVKLAEVEKEWAIRRPFNVRALRFFGVDQEKDGTPGVFSTIASGSIRFEKIQTLDGRDFEIALRSGQPLRVGEISRGYVRQVRLIGTGIHAEFSGDVSELRTVWGDRERNHMPSLLAVLSSKDELKAAGALLALLFGLLQVLGPGSTKS